MPEMSFVLELLVTVTVEKRLSAGGIMEGQSMRYVRAEFNVIPDC